MQSESVYQDNTQQQITACVVGAITTMAYAGVFVAAWLNPFIFDDIKPLLLVKNIFLLEFISLLMIIMFFIWSLRESSTIFDRAGVTWFALGFTWAILLLSYNYGGVVFMLSYSLVTATRVWAIYASSHEDRNFIILRAIFGLMLLLVSAIIIYSLPHIIPELGLTNEIKMKIVTDFRIDRVFIRDKEKDLALGVVYFTGIAAIELFIAAILFKSKRN